MNLRTYTYEIFRIGSASAERKTFRAGNAITAFYMLGEWSLLESIPIYSATVISIE